MVCVSLSGNSLGVEGGAAMAGAVQHLTSLTTLEYVRLGAVMGTMGCVGLAV